MAENILLQYCEEFITFVVGWFAAFCMGVWFVFFLFIRWARNPLNFFWKVKTRELPPECLNDSALGNHAYIQIKNVKLHYVEKGDRSNPLMLFLHGFPEFWFSWRHQLIEFSSDYWVVAVDMRGYGDSEKPVGQEHYRMHHLVADVKNLLVALGREKCTLVAHDWGGIIAWFFVLLEPQFIDSYIIMNSIHPIVYRDVLPKQPSQLMKSWYVFFFQLPWLPELMCRMDDMAFLTKALQGHKSDPTLSARELEAYKFYFGKPGAFKCPIDYYRGNFMLNSRGLLKGRGTADDFPQGLIIFGENDPYLNREIQEETARVVKNLSVVYIKEASHFVQQDDPVAVNEEMRKFFNKNRQLSRR